MIDPRYGESTYSLGIPTALSSSAATCEHLARCVVESDILVTQKGWVT